MVRRICRGVWPEGFGGRGPYRASARMMVVGSPYHTCMREGGGLHLVGEVGWSAFEVGRQVHEPQHSNGVADCVVLGSGLSSSVRLGGGGVHVADDDGGGEDGHLAVCLGQGLEEGLCRVAEGDVGVDDVELPSVPDDLLDTKCPWDAELADEVGVDAGPGIYGGTLSPVAFVRSLVRGIYGGGFWRVVAL